MNKFLRYWFPVLLYVTLIFTVSSMQNLKIPEVLGLSDKLVHSAEYGVLGFLLVRALRGTDLVAISVSAALVALIFGLAVGLADELYQAHVPGRISDPIDYAFDALGLVVSALLFLFLRVRRRGRRARA